MNNSGVYWTIWEPLSYRELVNNIINFVSTYLLTQSVLTAHSQTMEFPSTISPDVTAGLLSTDWPTVNGTSSTISGGAGSKAFLYAVKVVYVAGIVGNAAAIVAVRRGERRLRNRKHLLLLTALAVNDLVALVSIILLVIISYYGIGD